MHAEGYTALMLAAKVGNSEIMQMLIDHHATVNVAGTIAKMARNDKVSCSSVHIFLTQNLTGRRTHGLDVGRECWSRRVCSEVAYSRRQQEYERCRREYGDDVGTESGTQSRG